VEQDDVHDIPFHVPGGLGLPRLTVTLAWDDPDGAPNADPALVNDLDLVLIDPSAGEHRPWVLDPLQPSLPATTGVDSLNNLESVTVGFPQPGVWTARILGTNVPLGPQQACLAGIDVDPPSAPDSFQTSNPTSSSLDLTWIDDRPVDFAGTLVARLEGGSIWDGPVNGASYHEEEVVAPGVTIIYHRAENHSAFPLVDDGLEHSTTYEYAAYSFDDVRTYSPLAAASGTTETPAGIEPAEGIARFHMDAPRPNPGQRGDEIRVTFGVGERSVVALRVYDPAGRLVRTLHQGELEPGAYAAAWNGHDQAGRAVPSGVYFYELRAGALRASRSVTWLP
jgi:hypothetical protein